MGGWRADLTRLTMQPTSKMTWSHCKVSKEGRRSCRCGAEKKSRWLESAKRGRETAHNSKAVGIINLTAQTKRVGINLTAQPKQLFQSNSDVPSLDQLVCLYPVHIFHSLSMRSVVVCENTSTSTSGPHIPPSYAWGSVPPDAAATQDLEDHDWRSDHGC